MEQLDRHSFTASLLAAAPDDLASLVKDMDCSYLSPLPGTVFSVVADFTLSPVSLTLPDGSLRPFDDIHAWLFATLSKRFGQPVLVNVELRH